ncbi:MAG: hypothetical protein ABGZ17_11170, partial [Planctomycetaceae bacterium]
MTTTHKSKPRFSASIQSLLPRLADLSLSSAPPPKFFEKLIAELFASLELTAAAVWMLDGPNTFRLLYDRDLHLLWNDRDPVVSQQNQKLLNDIVHTPDACTRPFASTQISHSDAVFLLPVIRHDACIAIVQLFGPELHLPDNSVDVQPAIHEIQAVIDTYLERTEAADSGTDPSSYFKD